MDTVTFQFADLMEDIGDLMKLMSKINKGDNSDEQLFDDVRAVIASLYQNIEALNEGLDDSHKSNLVAYAETELDIIGMTEGSGDMNAEMRRDVLHLIRQFAKQGHSGFSAHYCIKMVEQLASFKPLSPLTGEDDEWHDCEGNIQQNKRCFSVFRNKKTGVAYDTQAFAFRDPETDVVYTSKKSAQRITFPYTPETQIMNEDDIPEPGELVH